MTYYNFKNENDEDFGSFEVFYNEDTLAETGVNEYPAGWYWWSCFPGCLPDSEAIGPFATAEAAKNDALTCD